jgi:hypothetical protein
MADTPLDDPELSLAIEQALAPFAALLPAATLDHLRREMEVQLGTHPHTAAMLRLLRPDPRVQESGTKVSEEAESIVTHGAPRAAVWGRRGKP